MIAPDRRHRLQLVHLWVERQETVPSGTVERIRGMNIRIGCTGSFNVSFIRTIVNAFGKSKFVSTLAQDFYCQRTVAIAQGPHNLHTFESSPTLKEISNEHDGLAIETAVRYCADVP